MSASPTPVVEHVVLFKARPATPSTLIQSWLEGARALHHIDGVLQLHVGAILTNPPHDRWTHVLYGRYKDKDALHAYAVHPEHLKVVAAGGAIMEDILALDWEAHVDVQSIGTKCAASRIVMLKCKEGVPKNGVAELLQVLGDDIPGSTHHTSGPNFSPARAKGHQWGFAAQFGSVSDLDGLGKNNHFDHLTHSPILESFLLLDVDFTIAGGSTAKI